LPTFPSALTCVAGSLEDKCVIDPALPGADTAVAAAAADPATRVPALLHQQLRTTELAGVPAFLSNMFVGAGAPRRGAVPQLAPRAGQMATTAVRALGNVARIDLALLQVCGVSRLERCFDDSVWCVQGALSEAEQTALVHALSFLLQAASHQEALYGLLLRELIVVVGCVVAAVHVRC
jgi:hypothetical protein